jgi:hypothetical protein
MKLRLTAIAVLFSLASWAETTAQQLTGFPFQDETLRFQAKWPTGAVLGEGRMQARRITGGGWEFELSLDASIPGFVLTDHYRSVATADLCSLEFGRQSDHGARKSRESVKFTQEQRTAHRATEGGGVSDISVPACAMDALSYFYFTRREMGQGRVPPAGPIVFGGPYDIRLEYKGEEKFKGAVTDLVAASVRGPSSTVTFDVLFARDPARSPVLIRLPLSLGTFTLELTH